MPPNSLDELRIFQDLTEDERSEIMALARAVEVRKGEQIITQGHHKQNLWFILEGRCQITRRTESGCQLNLAELEPFTHFGEMSFFHPAPHSADVVALTDMKLLKLAREDFDKLAATGCCSALKLVVNCVRVLAERLRRTDQWITELECKENHKPTPSEWTEFRKLIFKGG